MPLGQGTRRYRRRLGIEQLSAEQAAAVESRHPRFTVMAAAGSGKTRVLVERYVRLVREGVPPDKLVTITFTNKAAAEMKRKIVSRLLDEGLRKEAQAAETGPVQTIHSFCERILRANCLSAGVDPDFTVVAGEETNRLRLDAVHDALRLDLEGLPDAQRFVDRVGGETTFRSPRLDSLLTETIRAALDLRSTLVAKESLAAWSASPETVLAHVAAFLAQKTGGDWDAGADPQALVDALSVWKKTNRQLAGWVPAKLSAETERRTAEMTAGFVQLALCVWNRMEAVMEARQAFDFAMLERKALSLLQDSATAATVREQVKVVLVDEGQDMNPTQHALLAALDAQHEMVVGDPRQSIYGFRQADVSLFMRRLEEHPRLDLSKNYRSEPKLVRFIDKTYAMLTGEQPPAEADESLSAEELLGGPQEDFGGRIELLVCTDKGFADLTANRIAQAVADGVPPAEIAVLTRHGKSGMDIADRLRKLGIPTTVTGGSKGFLTNVEVLDVANVLEALIDPTNDFAMTAVMLSPFAGLSLDTVVRLSAKRPLAKSWDEVQLADEAEKERLSTMRGWFERHARLIDRATAWETISALYAQTPFLNSLARQPDAQQALANVRKLLTMAASEPDVGPVEFAHRIRELRTVQNDLTEPEIDDDSQGTVTVMTIHKAKGLEFGHVFLPDMHLQSPRESRALVDASTGTVVFGAKDSALAAYLTAESRRRNQQELRRVFYVGITRAKSKAYVTLQTGKQHGLTGELAQVLGVPGRTWPGVVLVGGPGE